jgi:hypothetical protein
LVTGLEAAAIECARARKVRTLGTYAHRILWQPAPRRRQPDARITIHVGGHERLEPDILKATPLGALGTEALIWIGATSIRGSAAALRALADAL